MDQQQSQQQTNQTNSSGNKVKNVFSVYVYMLLGLVVTGLTAAGAYRVEPVVSFVREHFIISMILTSVLMTITLSMFNSLEYPEQKVGKILLWLFISFQTGIPLVEANPDVLLRSAIYTALLVAILSVNAFIIPKNQVNSFIYPMTVLHSVVLVCTIYSILFGMADTKLSRIITAFCLHGGFLVYSTLLICNTQRLNLSAKYARFDPMFSAVVMYMNVINLLSRIATFCSIDGNLDCFVQL